MGIKHRLLHVFLSMQLAKISLGPYLDAMLAISFAYSNIFHLLLPSLNHQNMIPFHRLYLGPLGGTRRAHFQAKCHILKLLDQTPPRLQAQIASLPRLVLAKLPRDVVELGTLTQFVERLFFLAVLCAEDVPDVYGVCGLEFALSAVFALVRVGVLFIFGFGVFGGVFGASFLLVRRHIGTNRDGMKMAVETGLMLEVGRGRARTAESKQEG